MYYETMISRNIGTISNEQQQLLRNCCVAIAGVGGVGGLVAERLTRLGVGSLRITDPGTFEESNLNRQFGCTINSLGEYKSDVVSRELLRINPEMTIISDTSGVSNREDADRLVDGADIVIDAMDYPLFTESIHLARAARSRKIYYMFSSAIGFGATVAVFDPKAYTLEEFNGIQPHDDLSSVDLHKTSVVSVYDSLPGYLWETVEGEDIRKMVEGTKPVSTNSIGVGINCILVANEAINCLLKRKPVVCAPFYLHIDLLERVFEIKNCSGK